MKPSLRSVPAILATLVAVLLGACHSDGLVDSIGDPRPGILFTTEGDSGLLRVERMEPDGSGRRVLFANNSGVVTTGYKGRMIAMKYVGGAHSVAEYGLYIASTVGSIVSTLPGDRFSYVAALSPRGSELAYVQAGTNTLYVRSVSSGAETEIARDVADQITPAFSPDGARIAFVGYDGASQKLIVANIDGTGRTVIADSAWAPGFPEITWSPDGRSIAYIASRRGRHLAFIASVDDRSSRQLIDSRVGHRAATWSPDSRRLAVEASGELVLVDADGSDATTLFVAGDESTIGTPQWSRDGRTLMYIVTDVMIKRSQLYLHDLTTGTALVVADHVVTAYWDYSE
jgi:Tol biopolymer transport system component